jgi:hypothetical protein
MWTLLVGVVAWNTWPRTYVLADADARVPPLGAEMMRGILRQGETLTHAEFAARIKTKYPAYADLTDEELVTLTLKKYPSYSPFIKPLDLDEALRSVVASHDEPPKLVRTLSRARWLAGILALWLLPPAALYAFGCGVGWVYRGFKTS